MTWNLSKVISASVRVVRDALDETQLAHIDADLFDARSIAVVGVDVISEFGDCGLASLPSAM